MNIRESIKKMLVEQASITEAVELADEEAGLVADLVYDYLSDEMERLFDTHQYTKDLAEQHINICRKLSRFNPELTQLADDLDQMMKQEPDEFPDE